MKRTIAFIIAAFMILSFAVCACSSSRISDGSSESALSKAKIGVILVGDETEAYTKTHMDAIKEAMAANGIPEENVLWKYKVEENSDCYDAAADLYASGCRLIIANSYGHETYIDQAAEDFDKATYISITGDFAAVCGKNNLKNAFTKVYESRYVSGVVAGMKLKQLLEEKTLTPKKSPGSFDGDGNVRIGYIGAFSYPEVVSGYTAFYLGVRSIVENVVMEVKYTNSWFDIDKEAAAAQALVANGCVIIGQHADSIGAPSMCEKLFGEGSICYSVGYNVSMLETAPRVSLTSASNNWSVYYSYAFKTFLEGGDIKTDWAEGYESDSVSITKLGEPCAPGTEEKVGEVIKAIKSGDLKVFDTDTFTVGGKKVDSALIDTSYYDWTTGTPVLIYEGEIVEAVKDGYFSESTIRSAPYFSLRIDGITEDLE